MLLLASPIIISQLGHTLVQTADTMIIGHFAGTIPLAAASLSHSVFMIILVIGLGIAYGLTPLIAQENGKSNKEECANLLSNSFWINLVFGGILFCAVFFGSMAALDYAKQDPEVVKEAKPYLFILSLSIVPLMVFNTFKQFAEGLGFTKQAMKITIWGNVLNVLLGIILVKGMFGFEAMGLRGVGVATLIDRVLMMFAMMFYVLYSKHFKSYINFFSFFKVQFEKIKSILKIGIPVALQYVFEVGAFAGASIIAGMIGALDQASHQVALTLAAMTYMMASGIASAATIKIGNSYGNNDAESLQKYANVSYHLVVVLMIFFSIIFALFNDFLPYIFTKDLEVISLAAVLLIIACFFQLLDGTQVVGLGILRGMGDVNIPTFITFFAWWVVGLPSGYLMGIELGWGVKGVWYGLTLGLLMSSILLNLRYRYIVKNKLTLVTE